MKQEFIETANTKKFNELCSELADRSSLIGPSLAMVTGPAGRGKTEAAKHHATQTDAVYIPPLNTRTPAMVLISFPLSRRSLFGKRIRASNWNGTTSCIRP